MKKMFLGTLMALGTMGVFASSQPVQDSFLESNSCVARVESMSGDSVAAIYVIYTCECSQATACVVAGIIAATLAG